MAKVELPRTGQAEFEALVARLRRTPGADDPMRDGFGGHSLFAGRKMFAHQDLDGALVLRLPPERASELIEGGQGTGWGVSPGSPLKGYLRLSLAASDRWLPLAREARTYMTEKNLPKAAREKSRK